AHALVEGDAADQLQDRAGRALGHRAVPGNRKRALHRYSSVRRLEEPVFLQRNAPFAWREGKAARSVVLFEPQALPRMTVVVGTTAHHRLKLTGAFHLVVAAKRIGRIVSVALILLQKGESHVETTRRLFLLPQFPHSGRGTRPAQATGGAGLREQLELAYW